MNKAMQSEGRKNSVNEVHSGTADDPRENLMNSKYSPTKRKRSTKIRKNKNAGIWYIKIISKSSGRERNVFFSPFELSSSSKNRRSVKSNLKEDRGK